jgi:hypothetical protein
VIGCHADNLMRGNKSGKNFRVLKEIILHRWCIITKTMKLPAI